MNAIDHPHGGGGTGIRRINQFQGMLLQAQGGFIAPRRTGFKEGEEIMADEKKKVYYYKGKTYEELKCLKDDELMKIIGSRGRRSLKRGLSSQRRI
jgi:hypothetical protein